MKRFLKAIARQIRFPCLEINLTLTASDYVRKLSALSVRTWNNSRGIWTTININYILESIHSLVRWMIHSLGEQLVRAQFLVIKLSAVVVDDGDGGW